MLENNNENLGQFYIKVRVGNAEIEVGAPDREFVLQESNRLIEQFDLHTTMALTPRTDIVQGEIIDPTRLGANQIRAEKPETLAEFYNQFSLQTNLDKILVLGYWCEIRQNQQHFTFEDIKVRFKEIKENAPTNMNRDLGSLVSKGLLLPPEKFEDGTQGYALSRSGVKEVESKMAQN